MMMLIAFSLSLLYFVISSLAQEKTEIVATSTSICYQFNTDMCEKIRQFDTMYSKFYQRWYKLTLEDSESSRWILETQLKIPTLKF